MMTLLLSMILAHSSEAVPLPEPQAVSSNFRDIYNNIMSNPTSEMGGPTLAPNGTILTYQVTRQVSPASGVAGAMLIMAGFTFAFMGKRAFFPSIFLSGFFTLGIIAFVLLDVCQMHWHRFGPYADWIYFFVIVPIALLGGYLFKWYAQAAIICIGALNGFMWSIVVLFTGIGATLAPSTHLVVTLALTGMGTAAIFFMEHMALVLGTAFVGGFFVALGTDLFACTGYAEIVNRCIDGIPPHTSEIPGPAWGLLAAGLAIGAAAFYIQTRSSPPPPPDVVNNPAYWLFGAIPPSMPPPTWFLMPSNKAPEAPANAQTASGFSILNPFGWKW